MRSPFSASPLALGAYSCWRQRADFAISKSTVGLMFLAFSVDYIVFPRPPTAY
jgi:hypothetical protein